MKVSGPAGPSALLSCDGDILRASQRKFVVSLKLWQTSTRSESIRLMKLHVGVSGSHFLLWTCGQKQRCALKLDLSYEFHNIRLDFNASNL